MNTVRVDGTKLRTLLSEIGVKQLDVAAKIGVSHFNVNKWCKRGQLSNVKMGNMQKVAEALGMGYEDLIARCSVDANNKIDAERPKSDELALLEFYRAMPPTKRARALLAVEDIAKKDC
jgi:DNA-binding Xre family transcriptional regulator